MLDLTEAERGEVIGAVQTQAKKYQRVEAAQLIGAIGLRSPRKIIEGFVQLTSRRPMVVLRHSRERAFYGCFETFRASIPQLALM